MISLTTAAPTALARQVRHLISQRKAIQVGRLRRTSHLMRELQFDLVDIVDIILAVESRFHLTIPDEVPLVTVGDLVDYVVAETLAPARR